MSLNRSNCKANSFPKLALRQWASGRCPEETPAWLRMQLEIVSWLLKTYGKVQAYAWPYSWPHADSPAHMSCKVSLSNLLWDFPFYCLQPQTLKQMWRILWKRRGEMPQMWRRTADLLLPTGNIEVLLPMSFVVQIHVPSHTCGTQKAGILPWMIRCRQWL